MRVLLSTLAAAVLLFGSTVVGAEPFPKEPGSELVVSVLTFGPGDHPFFKFGHNAILVRDTERQRETVYNYGTFAFESWTLIPNFLRGRLRYWLSADSLSRTLRVYRRENRTVDEQVLELTPAQRHALATALERQAASEDRYYKYDYYRDNCSTRVRDRIDEVTHGALREVSKDPMRLTWRAHTLRLTQDDVPIALGLDIAMGSFIDQQQTLWEEMFLPSVLQQTLRRVRVKDAQGKLVPLVREERRLLDAPGRAPVPESPPRWVPAMLGVGTTLGGTLAALGRLGKTKKLARVAFGLAIALVGLLFGFLGCLFAMFWLLTDHQVAWRNENLLVCLPVLLALVPAGVGVARGRPAAMQTAARWLVVAAAVAVFAVFAKLAFGLAQDNLRVLALLVPLWLGGATGAVSLVGEFPVRPRLNRS